LNKILFAVNNMNSYQRKKEILILPFLMPCLLRDCSRRGIFIGSLSFLDICENYYTMKHCQRGMKYEGITKTFCKMTRIVIYYGKD